MGNDEKLKEYIIKYYNPNSLGYNFTADKDDSENCYSDGFQDGGNAELFKISEILGMGLEPQRTNIKIFIKDE